MNEWQFIPIHRDVWKTGKKLPWSVMLIYNEIYSGNSLNVCGVKRAVWLKWHGYTLQH